MAWRVVQQPDKRFAIFSDVVDDFIGADMTEEEVMAECVERSGRVVAEEKVRRAKECPERWAEALNTIRLLHGRTSP